MILSVAYVAFWDLLAVAASNGQANATASLLLQASRECRSLLAFSAPDPAMAQHPELLRAAVAIAAFTVAVGLWSVFRSSGVYLTPELACWG
ncbi:hypothetical protein DFJ74DRAFT_765633 [Hyaloraphidium curvatum]|nr:hypothetical protein DFJ74DRAFT_765633 [Hyaloraphidium curvatum]